MGDPIIRIDNLRKSFGTLTVIDGLSFDVHKGEKLALIGPSGSGKTTILRILMTLESLSGGRIEIDGQPLYHMQKNGAEVPADEAHLHKMRARIGMVFQHFNLFPHKSVLQNITLAPVLTQGQSRTAAERRGRELLDMVGLPSPAKRIDDYPHQLSGGQRQRVMIAMALANDPVLLIADEPTTALDVTIQAQILELLQNLQERTGTAILLITHDLGVVAETCDEVAVMYGGLVVERAPTRALFADPQHPYTTGLLASVPRLDQPRGIPLLPIPGSPSDTLAWAQGCAFAPRCTRQVPECLGGPPALLPVDGGVGTSHLVRCVNPVPSEVSP